MDSLAQIWILGWMPWEIFTKNLLLLISTNLFTRRDIFAIRFKLICFFIETYDINNYEAVAL